MPELLFIEITWPIAVGFVASVATICVSVFKIVSVRKEKIETVTPLECEQRSSCFKSQMAVQGTLLKEVMDDQRRQEEHIDKLNDQFIKILSTKE
jgi:hypothetical protein